MPGQFTRLQMTYRIAVDNVNPTTNKNEIPRYRGVVHIGEDTCKLPTDENVIPLGVVDNDERIDDPLRDGGSQAGRQIAVKLEGFAMIELSGAVAVTDRVILDVGGKAKKMPGTAGTYNVLGFAEKAGDEGDVIPVRMAFHLVTIPVTVPDEPEQPPVLLSGKSILTFALQAQTGDAVIDADAYTVAIEVANGTDVTGLEPVITVSEGAAVVPASGAATDFTDPVTYTVTAEDSTTQDWVVTVTVVD